MKKKKSNDANKFKIDAGNKMSEAYDSFAKFIPILAVNIHGICVFFGARNMVLKS